MKKLIIPSVLALAFASSAAMAHHPAEDIVDPDIYAMIDENVSDTPHADMTFDDMGSDVERDVEAAAREAQEARESQAEQIEAANEGFLERSQYSEQSGDEAQRDAMMEASDDFETVDLLDRVVSETSFQN